MLRVPTLPTRGLLPFFSFMTRATLLQLLAHPTALTGADVRALEQLADAFPYCQTAHLLLAKAAHDQGSMLAGQRLRRAATYAADRTRLRHLIELVPAEPLAVAAAAPAEEIPVLEAPATLPSVSSDADLPEQHVVLEQLAAIDQPAVAILLEDQPHQVLHPLLPAETAEADEAPLAEAAPATAQPALVEATEPAISVTAEHLPAEAVVAAEEAELPPQAPPIWPPAEAEAAHFEFGLAAEEPAEIVAYRLPELEEPLATPAPEPTTPRLPAFSGLAGVGYAPEEGSRLGFCLLSTEDANGLPSTSLPPTGEFFAPDASLLAHLAANQPAAPKASSLDLINSFLKRTPGPARRRVAPLPTAPEPDAQADLSVRSTRAEPDLASESLAKILARQGKTDRAIAVYERLMVKHPEKIAYFTAQIESLRPSA
jgi:hypothetical protein